jgi:hypothetical protein
VAIRSQLRHAILALLSEQDCTSDWLRANKRLDLVPMLLRLFPSAASASVEEQHRHLTSLSFVDDTMPNQLKKKTRLLCGAFTNGQATSAAKALGFDPAEKGRSTLRQLRLLCLEHIDKMYSSRK